MNTDTTDLATANAAHSLVSFRDTPVSWYGHHVGPRRDGGTGSSVAKAHFGEGDSCRYLNGAVLVDRLRCSGAVILESFHCRRTCKKALM